MRTTREMALFAKPNNIERMCEVVSIVMMSLGCGGKPAARTLSSADKFPSYNSVAHLASRLPFVQVAQSRRFACPVSKLQIMELVFFYPLLGSIVLALFLFFLAQQNATGWDVMRVVPAFSSSFDDLLVFGVVAAEILPPPFSLFVCHVKG